MQGAGALPQAGAQQRNGTLSVRADEHGRFCYVQSMNHTPRDRSALFPVWLRRFSWLPPSPCTPNPEYYPKSNCPKKHIYNQQFKRHRALFIYTKTFSEVKMKTKRIITLAICLLTLISIFQSPPRIGRGKHGHNREPDQQRL